MHRSPSRRATPVLVVATMLLSVACSRVPPGGELSIGEDAPAQVGTSTDGSVDVGFGSSGTDATSPDDATGATGATATSEATTGGGSTTGSSGSDTSGAGATSGSTSGSTSDTDGDTTTGTGSTDDTGQPPPAAMGPGIDGRTIKVVFAAHWEDCAEDTNEPRDDVRAKGQKIIHEYTKFFNEYVLKEFDWTLEPIIVDHGGYFCPERQRAAGLAIAQEIQPFAVLGTSESAQGPILADIVTRAGILHVGKNWTTTAAERARHPYAWNNFASPEINLRFLVDWMATRIKGTTVPDRVSGTGLEVGRVYGILGVDDAAGQELVKLTREALVANGFEVAGVYMTSPDPGVTAQQAPSTVAKMKDDGINTLVFGEGGGGAFLVPFSNTMDAQRYYPDIMVGTYGVAFFDQLYNKSVWANVKGTSPAPAIALRVETDEQGRAHPDYQDINENSSAYQKAWAKLGHSDNPQEGSFPSAFGTWTNLAMLATGIIHAGDTLNAHTFAEGLDSAGTPGSPNRCTVGRLMGRDYKHVPSYDWDSAHDGGVTGWTPIYWVNQPNGLSSGYYESYDNYLYFHEKSQLPPAPTHDTGEDPPALEKQERIGLEPWLSCSEFPDYPR